ncbi:MAG TPA: carbon monoxide dehydrogenase subunit G [Caulobacteraceae bacterium]|nr:carbon monoxide dehydrogenase subunit G [Caulobacteraceae bacterium]
MGEYRIDVPRARVWAALNDAEVLKRCIDGCEELAKTGENAFHAVVRARLGPVNAAFAGDVVLKNLDPPAGYTLEVSAKGGAAGFASGTAKVTLTEDGGATLIAYAAEGRVGGKLAQIGQRLIDAAARKTADDFFAALVRELSPPGAATPSRAARPSPLVIWGGVAAVAVALALLAWRLIGG